MSVWSLFFVAFLFALHCKSFAQAPQQIDQDRAERYREKLKTLAETRSAIRQQCTSIELREFNLAQQMQFHWADAIIKYQAAMNTPKFIATPMLRNIASTQGTFGTKLLRGDPAASGIWYRLQDNSFSKTILSIRALEQQGAAMQALNALRTNRLALLDVSNQADRNFQNLRQLADWLGRRSVAEHQTAQRITSEVLIDDPRNAGIDRCMLASKSWKIWRIRRIDE
jgi:hypothetical protein